MASKTDGFVSIPNWLYDDSDLTLHEFMVYGVLLRFRDHKTGECFAGMTTIADRARVSRETVKRTIPKLEAKGMIRVKRVKTAAGKNEVNRYEVALATQTPEFIWANTKRGKRIPKRSPRRSETLPAEEAPEGRHSQTPPRHSQTPPLGTPSASNKTQENKIHEQALRQAKDRPHDDFTFEITEEHPTSKQLDYLNDLHIFLTERIPDTSTRTRWEALTPTDASHLIDKYWQQMDRGRGGNWESDVDEYHPAYNHLSPMGKQWIYNGCVPDGQVFAA